MEQDRKPTAPAPQGNESGPRESLGAETLAYAFQSEPASNVTMRTVEQKSHTPEMANLTAAVSRLAFQP